MFCLATTCFLTPTSYFMQKLPKCYLTSAISLLLIACSFVQSAVEEPPTWRDLGCDSTQQVSSLSVYDLVQPFYASDTLQLVQPANKVYAVVVESSGNMYGTGIAKLDSNVLATGAITPWKISWTEAQYLRALIESPRYLYQRWEKILASDRAIFLAKRDSIKAIMGEKYRVQVISDLRSMENQQKYLQRKRSAAPVSMHNFGLAADFGIIRKRKVSNNLNSYSSLNELTAQFGLTWGGNFVGFIDPGHIQYFKNAAALLKKYPALRFEFEPYRQHYLKAMEQAEKTGKQAKYLDTAELLSTLNLLRKDQACACQGKAVTVPLSTLKKIQQNLSTTGYASNTDILLVGDFSTQSLSVITPTQTISYPLGTWR